MREEKEAREEELARHQKQICDKMAKMDFFLQQYQQRKDKRQEKERQQVKFQDGVTVVTRIRRAS